MRNFVEINVFGNMVGSLEFKGIVRATSAQNNADGNCEEIINMRYDSGVWKSVGKKRSILKGVQYEDVYVHKYGDFENYIGVNGGKVIWFASLVDGEVVERNQEICDGVGEISFNQMNNILLIRDDFGITKSIFFNGFYNIGFVDLIDLPVISFGFEKLSLEPLGDEYVGFRKVIGPYDFEDTEGCKLIKESLVAALNAYKDSNPNYEEGRVFVCTSYTLFDGSETKISPMYCIDLGGDSYHDDISQLVQFDNNDYYIEEKNDSGIGEKQKFCISFPKLNLYRMSVVPGGIDEKYEDIISRINVYVSRPFSFYDTDDVIIPLRYNVRMVFRERKFSSIDVEKVLLYKVASWDKSNYAGVTIDFENLTTYPVMPVDVSGWIRSNGNMFVYNNRLHLFGLRRNFIESDVLGYCYSFADMNLMPNGYERKKTAVYVYSNINNNEIVVRYDFDGAYKDGKLRLPKVVTFPDSSVYKMAFYCLEYSCIPFVVDMSKFASYNMSFSVLEEVFVDINVSDKQSEFPVVVNKWSDFTNLISSKASNPYYFPPEYSYMMPGDIVNLAVNTEQISMSQVGMFPLYVFTTEGVYALQVGDGNVLYSNVIPVSADVALKGCDVFQTKSGIVFVTESGLKMISGQNVVDLSEPVNGLPDMNIRKSLQYMKAISHEYTMDIRNEISQVDFREYILSAVMGYDISNDELIVSNSDYNYSYVYSFESRMWYKITEVFNGFQRHFCIQRHECSLDLCDVRIEDDVVLPVLIQTRPVILDSFGFKSIFHVALRGEFKALPEDRKKYYGSYVFASNDLVNWHCVSEKIIAGELLSVVLSRIAKSFRYFVFMTGGYVNPSHCVTVLEVEGEEKYNNRLR